MQPQDLLQNQDFSSRYEEFFKDFLPEMAAIHRYLPSLVKGPQVLVVGGGQGAELKALAPIGPDWEFTVFERSQPMAHYLERACSGISSQVRLYKESYPPPKKLSGFDSALCILVRHLLPRTLADEILRAMAESLKSGGQLICADIWAHSEEDYSNSLEMILDRARRGKIAEKYPTVPLASMKESLTWFQPDEIKRVCNNIGLTEPSVFFQTGVYHAWQCSRQS